MIFDYLKKILNFLTINFLFFTLKKLAQCQAKLMEVMRTETLDENTGIAMDRNGKSLGFVDVRTLL